MPFYDYKSHRRDAHQDGKKIIPWTA
jgi:hypothetical protein